MSDATATRPVIELDRVCRSYHLGGETVHALRDVSLCVRAGDNVAIVGPSGSGKSTLMNIIGCLDQPDTGSYVLDGVDVRDRSSDDLATIRGTKIGFVFQQFNLIPRTSALENVALPLYYQGINSRERHKRALSALAQVGLGDRADHRPSELSGGQQQRVAIARAIVTDPSLILADEPTGALDTNTTAAVMEILAELCAGGRTIIVITHEPEVAAGSNRVVTIRDGRIATESEQEEIVAA